MASPQVETSRSTDKRRASLLKLIHIILCISVIGALIFIVKNKRDKLHEHFRFRYRISILTRSDLKRAYNWFISIIDHIHKNTRVGKTFEFKYRIRARFFRASYSYNNSRSKPRKREKEREVQRNQSRNFAVNVFN